MHSCHTQTEENDFLTPSATRIWLKTQWYQCKNNPSDYKKFPRRRCSYSNHYRTLFTSCIQKEKMYFSFVIRVKFLQFHLTEPKICCIAKIERKTTQKTKQTTNLKNMKYISVIPLYYITYLANTCHIKHRNDSWQSCPAQTLFFMQNTIM